MVICTYRQTTDELFLPIQTFFHKKHTWFLLQQDNMVHVLIRIQFGYVHFSLPNLKNIFSNRR